MNKNILDQLQVVDEAGMRVRSAQYDFESAHRDLLSLVLEEIGRGRLPVNCLKLNLATVRRAANRKG
jgi:hypothetical protein